MRSAAKRQSPSCGKGWKEFWTSPERACDFATVGEAVSKGHSILLLPSMVSPEDCAALAVYGRSVDEARGC